MQTCILPNTCNVCFECAECVKGTLWHTFLPMPATPVLNVPAILPVCSEPPPAPRLQRPPNSLLTTSATRWTQTTPSTQQHCHLTQRSCQGGQMRVSASQYRCGIVWRPNQTFHGSCFATVPCFDGHLLIMLQPAAGESCKSC